MLNDLRASDAELLELDSEVDNWLVGWTSTSIPTEAQRRRLYIKHKVANARRYGQSALRKAIQEGCALPIHLPHLWHPVEQCLVEARQRDSTFRSAEIYLGPDPREVGYQVPLRIPIYHSLTELGL